MRWFGQFPEIDVICLAMNLVEGPDLYQQFFIGHIIVYNASQVFRTQKLFRQMEVVCFDTFEFTCVCDPVDRSRSEPLKCTDNIFEMHRQYLWISLKCTDNISTWAGSQVMRGYFTPVRPHHPWSRPNPTAPDFFWGKNPRLAKKHHSMPLKGLISNSRTNVEFYEQLADWRPLFNWMLFFPLWTLIPWINPVQCHGLTKWQNGSRATCSGTFCPNAHQSLVSKPSVTWVSLRMADYDPLLLEISFGAIKNDYCRVFTSVTLYVIKILQKAPSVLIFTSFG